MNTARRAAVLAAALSLLAPPLALAAGDTAVKVATKQELGSYLTDGKGMTLYVFKKDTSGKSACAGDCAKRWPLFHAEKVAPSGGAKASDFATITRDDGQKQTTYKGLPLYYFVQDKAPNDTTGHGVNDVWFVAKP